MKKQPSVAVRKQQVFDRLITHAKQGQTQSYHKLMLDLFRSRKYHGTYLGELCVRCINANLPLLPVLAVTKASKDVDGLGKPSYGFLEFPPVLKAMCDAGYTSKIAWTMDEQQRCFDYYKEKPSET